MDSRLRDVLIGLRNGTAVAALALAVGLPVLHAVRSRPAAAVPPPAVATARPPEPDFGAVVPTDDVRRVATWAVGQRDNGALPFAMIDKRDARLYVFDPAGRLRGHSPILLGVAPGDDTVPGIGNRPLDQVRPEERTTPAGRFVAEPGRNLRQETVIWIDYDAAVSMHRVLTTHPAERRLERLASPDPAERRISWGCVNVPRDFFEQVLWPALGGQRSIVYVLPERKPLRAVFPGAASQGSSRALPASLS